MSSILSSKNNIRIRITREGNGEQIFKTIISHPMETGYRRDKQSGKNIPADYIDDFLVSIDGEKIIGFRLGENVSKNPYLSFHIKKPLYEGQQMQVSWTDNSGNQTLHDFVLEFDQDGRFSFSNARQPDSQPVRNKQEIYQFSPGVQKPVCKSRQSGSAN